MGILHHSHNARSCGFKGNQFSFVRTDRKRKSTALDIQLKREQTERALASLQELVPQFLENKENIILRDAMIQRFEYSTEAFWNTLKFFYLSSIIYLPIVLGMSFVQDLLQNYTVKKFLKNFCKCWMIETLPVIPMFRNSLNPLLVVFQTIPKI